MTKYTMSGTDNKHDTAMPSLSQGQLAAFRALIAGAALPMVLLGVVRPVFWLVAFQLACLTGISYIRWRSPAFQGSLAVFICAAVTCMVSVVVALAAAA